MRFGCVVVGGAGDKEVQRKESAEDEHDDGSDHEIAFASVTAVDFLKGWRRFFTVQALESFFVFREREPFDARVFYSGGVLGFHGVHDGWGVVIGGGVCGLLRLLIFFGLFLGLFVFFFLGRFSFLGRFFFCGFRFLGGFIRGRFFFSGSRCLRGFIRGRFFFSGFRFLRGFFCRRGSSCRGYGSGFCIGCAGVGERIDDGKFADVLAALHTERRRGLLGGFVTAFTAVCERAAHRNGGLKTLLGVFVERDF